MEIPRGYVFSPKEEELLGYYLRRRVNGQPLPQGVIKECDVYGDKNPWEIFREMKPNSSSSSSSTDDPFYVFTRLKKRKRTAGCGTWEGAAKERHTIREQSFVLCRIYDKNAKDANKKKKRDDDVSPAASDSCNTTTDYCREEDDERSHHHVLIQPSPPPPPPPRPTQFIIRACDVFPERFSTPLFRNMDLRTFMALDASLNQILGDDHLIIPRCH
ncbi:hypothetical protein Tsubulata_041923 [Turnera subulata]|uniref:NAC domain-containing protein n=1 Tax=Turnera subulata TaxID=218843 RepID=A0A9Q0JRB3_9ROSI|nr:hypothetical protein Tsubulata_041923 [Turnera subulata]